METMIHETMQASQGTQPQREMCTRCWLHISRAEEAKRRERGDYIPPADWRDARWCGKHVLLRSYIDKSTGHYIQEAELCNCRGDRRCHAYFKDGAPWEVVYDSRDNIYRDTPVITKDMMYDATDVLKSTTSSRDEVVAAKNVLFGVDGKNASIVPDEVYSALRQAHFEDNLIF